MRVGVLLKWGVITVVFAGLLTLLAYLLVVNGFIRLNYPSRDIYPIQGIDVSHYQGEIDWQLVAEDHIDFVIIKSTEGVDFKDDIFLYNFKEASKQGVKVGAYHYFSFCTNPVEQAKNYINHVGCHKGMLPPAIDLEYDKNCNGDIDKKELIKKLKSYLKEVRSVYGEFVIIYSNESFYAKYLQGEELGSVYFWVRNVYKQPSNPQDWKIWQHSAKGNVRGIEGDVDLNVFKGDEDDFESFLLH